MRVLGYGAPPDKAKAVIVGEAPGRTEARKGRPFVGPSGRLIRSVLGHAGFQVLSCKDAAEGGDEPEVFFTNASLCLPIGGDAEMYLTSDAKKLAALCCYDRLKEELLPYAKAGIPLCAVGGSSSAVLVGNAAITKIRSRWHTKGSTKILTTWHPAYILRQPVRVGELVRDIQKLAFGGPKYDAATQPKTHWRIVPNETQLWELAHQLSDGCKDGTIKDSTICLDIETDNVDWWKDQILCYGLAWDLDQAAIIPDNLVYQESTQQVLTWLFDQPHIKWMGHNFKFDIRFIRHQTGVHNARVDYDSLIADYVLDENRRHALKDLLTEFYDIPDYEANLVQRYLKNKNDRYSKVPRPQLYKYCVYDVVYTLKLWRDLRLQLEQRGLWEQPFLYPLMASQEMYLAAELHGMLIDKEQMTLLSQQLRQRLQLALSTLEEMAGTTFNPNSPKQVSIIMYDTFKMPEQPIRNVPKKSTSRPIRDLIMAHYRDKDQTDSPAYRWISVYDGWKQLEKIRSSYVDNLIPLVDEHGRVHPDVLVYGTETGRVSVRNPALQTIPRSDTGQVDGEVWGERIKLCYTVPPGYKMLQVDYSQAELRTAAALSGDPFLIQCYKNGLDVHGEVAEAYFPGWFTLEDKKLKTFRRKKVKMCVFGRLYLGTEYTIRDTLGCTLKEARMKLAVLDGLIGGLVVWEHEQFKIMRRQGYVTTLTNRRRRIPLVTRSNIDDARKAACNAPVQGMASDLTLMAAIETHDWLEQSQIAVRVDGELHQPHILLTVHDSILLEVPDSLVDEVAGKVKAIMEGMGTKWMPQIPWKADVEVGRSWGTLEDYELKGDKLKEDIRRAYTTILATAFGL